jgi:hypothetical protein
LGTSDHNMVCCMIEGSGWLIPVGGRARACCKPQALVHFVLISLTELTCLMGSIV